MTVWKRTYDGKNLHLMPIPGLRPFHGVLMGAVPPDVVENVRTAAEAPLVGVTTDGTAIPGLYESTKAHDEVAALVEVANAYLACVDQLDYRDYTEQPFDSWHRRSWFNAAPLYLPAGVLLDDMRPEQQAAALEVVAKSFSTKGFELIRKSMLVNEALGELFNFYTDTFREYAVWFTIFGTPSTDQPWGWQLMGTHIDINCTVVDGTIMVEPLFLGAEVCEIKEGRHQGLTVYSEERDKAIALGATLSEEQRAAAILYPSMLSQDLPPEIGGPFDGRHIGGAGRDNEVVPYAGIKVTDLTESQRDLLVELIDVYLERLIESRRVHRREEILAHLDETHVAWIGDPETAPFYYRIHSPTLWIEFDHHPGLMMGDDMEAIQDHVHTIMRAPNGGDYGHALIGHHHHHGHDHDHPHSH
ncbi:MAG: DUF3500 domain-containing protein [Gordonia amarae]